MPVDVKHTQRELQLLRSPAFQGLAPNQQMAAYKQLLSEDTPEFARVPRALQEKEVTARIAAGQPGLLESAGSYLPVVGHAIEGYRSAQAGEPARPFTHALTEAVPPQVPGFGGDTEELLADPGMRAVAEGVRGAAEMFGLYKLMGPIVSAAASRMGLGARVAEGLAKSALAETTAGGATRLAQQAAAKATVANLVERVGTDLTVGEAMGAINALETGEVSPLRQFIAEPAINAGLGLALMGVGRFMKRFPLARRNIEILQKENLGEIAPELGQHVNDAHTIAKEVARTMKVSADEAGEMVYNAASGPMAKRGGQLDAVTWTLLKNPRLLETPFAQHLIRMQRRQIAEPAMHVTTDPEITVHYEPMKSDVWTEGDRPRIDKKITVKPTEIDAFMDRVNAGDVHLISVEAQEGLLPRFQPQRAGSELGPMAHPETIVPEGAPTFEPKYEGQAELLSITAHASSEALTPPSVPAPVPPTAKTLFSPEDQARLGTAAQKMHTNVQRLTGEARGEMQALQGETAAIKQEFDADMDRVEGVNNASGDSSASMEAQSRARTQATYAWADGKVVPKPGVDGVDYVAKPNEISFVLKRDPVSGKLDIEPRDAGEKITAASLARFKATKDQILKDLSEKAFKPTTTKKASPAAEAKATAMKVGNMDAAPILDIPTTDMTVPPSAPKRPDVPPTATNVSNLADARKAREPKISDSDQMSQVLEALEARRKPSTASPEEIFDMVSHVKEVWGDSQKLMGLTDEQLTRFVRKFLNDDQAYGVISDKTAGEVVKQLRAELSAGEIPLTTILPGTIDEIHSPIQDFEQKYQVGEQIVLPGMTSPEPIRQLKPLQRSALVGNKWWIINDQGDFVEPLFAANIKPPSKADLVPMPGRTYTKRQLKSMEERQSLIRRSVSDRMVNQARRTYQSPEQLAAEIKVRPLIVLGLDGAPRIVRPDLKDPNFITIRDFIIDQEITTQVGDLFHELKKGGVTALDVEKIDPSGLAGVAANLQGSALRSLERSQIKGQTPEQIINHLETARDDVMMTRYTMEMMAEKYGWDINKTDTSLEALWEKRLSEAIDLGIFDPCRRK